MCAGLETHAVLWRLSALQDQSGAHWLIGAELDVAARLRSDWELSQVGLVRAGRAMR
jgi:hypothetical protein